MNVIINVESIRYPLTGIGRYTYELTKQLINSEKIDQLHLYSAGRFLEKIPKQPDKSIHNSLKTNTLSQTKIANKIYYSTMSKIRSFGLRKCRNALYHSPNYYLPRFDGPCIATFHDLSTFKWPSCHEPNKLPALQKALADTLQIADRLITDSEFIRHELANFSGISLNKIDAIPLGFSNQFKPRGRDEIDATLQKYNLNYQKYSLFVGTIEPRKNIKNLINAYKKINKKTKNEYPLVIIGHKGWKSEEIHKVICNEEENGWLRYMGYLSDTELPSIYSGARLFIYPSHYEGFGLPIIEAMASGVPIITSNSSCLPEVAHELALMSDPNDVETLYNHIKKGLDDNLWREKSIKLGIEKSNRYSWQRCAEETINSYQLL